MEAIRVSPDISDLSPRLAPSSLQSVEQSVKREIQAIDEAISTITLSQGQKRILQLRVNGLLREYGFRTRIYSISFHSLRTTTTVGSLIVPALLSAQYVNGNVTMDTANIGVKVYWSVWVISLFVTICNGLMNLMKIDKKYYMLHSCYQHIVSEVWQYVQLSGKFSGQYTPGQEPTHTNQYIYICSILEKIRMKHIEEEYYKVTEQNATSAGDSLIPTAPSRELSVPPVNGSSAIGTTLRRLPLAEEGHSTVQAQQSAR
jgi:hypothetical protein